MELRRPTITWTREGNFEELIVDGGVKIGISQIRVAYESMVEDLSRLVEELSFSKLVENALDGCERNNNVEVGFTAIESKLEETMGNLFESPQFRKEKD